MPSVSCILPTKDRPHFLTKAIEYYRQQTFLQSELIIVDDSAVPCEHLVPSCSNIRYIHLSRPTSLGMKLNLGISESSAPIIQKLDDDDYYHPAFLDSVVSTLSGENCSDVIAALDTFLVMVAGHRQLFDAGTGWFAGATLCFPRQLWSKQPFRDAPNRVDALFLEDHQGIRKLRISNPELLVVVRHAQNTWNHMRPKPGRNLSVPLLGPEGENVSEYFLRCPIYPKSLEDVIGAEHVSFYENAAGIIPPRNVLALSSSV